MELPNKKYNVILCDPPWQYRVHVTDNNGTRNANHFYDTMPLDEIKRLRVNDIADKSCALFMWVTNPCLPEGLEVIKSWGFEFKTVAFIWVKTYNSGKIWLGLGHYTRNSAEMCLLATKGKPLKVLDKSIKQVLVERRTTHSRKPDRVRHLITRMYGDVPKIELFARQRVEGWEAWGNEVPASSQSHLLDTFLR